MEFYQKLQMLRKGRGMSQEELASQLNVSRQSVSKWENGQGFPETDKLLLISNLFGVSLDYLLKSEGDAAGGEGEMEAGYYASREMVEGFLQHRRLGAKRIALGVAILILALVPSMLLPRGLGGVGFLLMAGCGVAVLVSLLFRANPYTALETQPLVFDPTFLRQFREGWAAERKRYGTGIIAGILVIILGFVAMMISDDVLPFAVDYSSAVFPVFVAVGVALLIISGSALTAGGLIAHNEEHALELVEGKTSGWVYGAIMPLATVVFLAIGFIWGAWHPGWLVFPAAALIGSAIVAVMKNRG